MAEFPASLLILNGKSTDNLPLREAIMLLREEGMTIHVRVTWEKGDAARYVEEARKLGVATVIAGGGDGTINEVSTALIQCEGDGIPALGILPLGTANDFATSVGIPEALDKALKLAIAGNAIAIEQAPHEITFNLDGEPLSGQNFHIEILPAALRCRLPPDCLLLR
ncbi:YegS/Rv2252/BmrU family lipid kinase [Shigella sonnei]|nr:YegS/Rv2252/BmrU family lipid kinase [Shigella sonnei]